MKFLKILFYNLYHYHIKYGHKDDPVYVSFLTILLLFYVDLFTLGADIDRWFITDLKLINLMTALAIILTLCVGITGYCILLLKKRYETVIGEKEYGSRKYKIITITFINVSIIFVIGSILIL